MAGIARRVLIGFVVLQFISIHLSGFALADGVVLSKYVDIIYLDEDSQSATIDYCDGIQRMLISIELEWQDLESVAWIYPIPSDPEQVQTDIADGAPVFQGTDVVEEAKGNLAESVSTFFVGYATSVFFPLPLTLLVSRFFLSWTGYGVAPVTALGGEGGQGGGGTTVTVHSHIEKYGLVVEVVSATEGQGIYNYLTGQGLEVSAGSVPQLDDYVEMGYSFVVTWVEYSTENSRELGVVVEFPTQRIFYPLMLTSIYGDDVIPMTLVVTKHVDPNLYSEIKADSNVRYFHRGYVRLDYGGQNSLEIWEFVDKIKGNWNGEFTVIEISTPSKNLKEDLWMTSGAPDRVKTATSITAAFSGPGSVLTLMLIILVASVLAQLTVGGLYIGWKKHNLPYYILMGMANLAGLAIFIFLAYRVWMRMIVDTENYPQTFTRFMGLFFVVFVCYVLLIFSVFFFALL